MEGHLAALLTDAFNACVEVRADDPLRFISHWLMRETGAGRVRGAAGGAKRDAVVQSEQPPHGHTALTTGPDGAAYEAYFEAVAPDLESAMGTAVTVVMQGGGPSTEMPKQLALHLLAQAGDEVEPEALRRDQEVKCAPAGSGAATSRRWAFYSSAPDSAAHSPLRPEPSGGDYEGEHNEAGEREGRGTFRFVGGAVYEGEWMSGEMDGRGHYRFEDGAYFEGEWRAGSREGRGSVRFADGSVCEGEWKAGARHGVGSFRGHPGDDGVVEVGAFEAGKCVGEWVLCDAGRQEACLLRDGEPQGQISFDDASAMAAQKLRRGLATGLVGRVMGRVGAP